VSSKAKSNARSDAVASVHLQSNITSGTAFAFISCTWKLTEFCRAIGLRLSIRQAFAVFVMQPRSVFEGK
jgi:hypothetical protein